MAAAEVPPDEAEQFVLRSNETWWENLSPDLQFLTKVKNPVIFAKLYLLPNKDRKTLHPIPVTELVAGGEAMVCVLILPPKLDGTSVARSSRNSIRDALAKDAPRLPTHPWSQINIKDMVDKGLIYSRTLREGEFDDVDIVEGNVGTYPTGTTHYWYKVQPYDGLSRYASPYRKPVHGVMADPPKTVPNADIHYGCVTIVEDSDKRFTPVTPATLSGQGVSPPHGGNKYSRKHKSTKRTKKHNKRNSRRNRRRYRTRNRR
jgi:hypothetical protein